MANVKEEPVKVVEEEEEEERPAIPPGYEFRYRRTWPWPPLARPRRSPRGHPSPRPYIRRPRRRVIKEEPVLE